MKKIFFLTGGAIILGVAWYGLSPLLRNKTVNDALPPVSTSSEINSLKVGGQQTVPAEPTAVPIVISEPVAIVATPAHPASGVVRIVNTGSETVIRYENYKTINGPDVRVYLAKDLEAKEFVDLGPIKGTTGNINYSVPLGVNIDEYRYVLTWCEDFSVLFNSADLSTIR